MLKALIAALGKPDHEDREWANFDCPFCGGKKKLGIKLSTMGTHCFKCGSSPWIGDLLRKLGVKAPPLRKPSARAKQNIESFKMIDMSTWDRLTCRSSGPYNQRLLDYACGRGVNPDQWEIGTFDHLPDRVSFLIRDSGVAVSYQARTIYDHVKPKTLNPPSGVGVPKGSLLFGSSNITHGTTVVVTEGMFDAVTAHQPDLGFSAVALLGKTATKEQLESLLSTPSANVVVALDRDAIADSLKLAFLLMEGGKNASVIEWPASHHYKDPNEAGRQEMAKMLQTAKPVRFSDLIREKSSASLRRSCLLSQQKSQRCLRLSSSTSQGP